MATVLPHRATVDARHRDAMRHINRALESVVSRALKVRLWGIYDALDPSHDEDDLARIEGDFDEPERADYRMGIELVRGVHK